MVKMQHEDFQRLLQEYLDRITPEAQALGARKTTKPISNCAGAT